MFTYRLVAQGCIEESIVRRQRSKHGLAAVTEEGGEGEVEGEGEEDGDEGSGSIIGGGTGGRSRSSRGSKGSSGIPVSLTKKDLLQLIYPSLSSSLNTTTLPLPLSSVDGKEVNEVDEVITELDENNDAVYALDGLLNTVRAELIGSNILQKVIRGN